MDVIHSVTLRVENLMRSGRIGTSKLLLVVRRAQLLVCVTAAEMMKNANVHGAESGGAKLPTYEGAPPTCLCPQKPFNLCVLGQASIRRPSAV
jgi:hypothetical protein